MWIFQVGARGPILVFLESQYSGLKWKNSGPKWKTRDKSEKPRKFYVPKKLLFYGYSWFLTFWDYNERHQATTQGIAVELPSQVAICKNWSKISDFKIESCLKLWSRGLPSQIQVKQLTVSFQSYHSFRRLASWIPGRCRCSSFSYRSQVLSAFKQWNRHSRD